MRCAISFETRRHVIYFLLMIAGKYSNDTIARPLLPLLSSLHPLMLMSDNLFRFGLDSHFLSITRLALAKRTGVCTM